MRKIIHNENNRYVKGKLVIPYVWDTLERIPRIATKYALCNVFHSRYILGNVWCNIEPEIPKLKCKNVLHSLPRELYFGETSMPLEARLANHRKNIKD